MIVPTNSPEISPDPHFSAKLATITSREELAAFHAGIPPQRRLSDGELRLIDLKFGELRRDRK